MSVKGALKSQYRASLAMLWQAVEKCPEELWADASYVNPFWRVIYHTIIYTHFYLSPTEADFVPWERHKKDMQLLGPSAPEAIPYSKAETLEYIALCLEQVELQMDALDLEAESGFYWLPFDKLELQFYNIRHIMQHTGELCELLGAYGEIEVSWVGWDTHQ